MSEANRETLKQLLQQMRDGTESSKDNTTNGKPTEKESWLPVFLVNPIDRTKGPKEPSFEGWISKVRPELKRLIDNMAKDGIVMTENEALEFMAWGMEVTLSRIDWMTGRDSSITQAVISAAFDIKQRFIATKTGVFPPPIGMRFDSIQAFEDDLKGRFPGEFDAPKASTRQVSEYVPGGYL